MLEINKIYCGDCLKVMNKIDNQSIDMVLVDPPYGITRCKWDEIIPLESMWHQLKRIIKSNGAIVMTASQPFTSLLICSNKKMFKYTLVWNKTKVTGYYNVKRRPLVVHEDIVVFYNKQPLYNPLKTIGHRRKIVLAKYKKKTKSVNPDIYNKTRAFIDYDSTERYPISIIKFGNDRQRYVFHPTQKPVSLCEYLIKTYTNKNDLVLDNCIGSGTTAIACINTNRQYIGIDNSAEYCKIARKRVKAAEKCKNGVEI